MAERKYGKRSKVTVDPSRYIIGLLGESGVGKTTTLSKVCETLFGEDGYIMLDMGKEDGMACLDGYTYETINTFRASAKQEESGIVGFENLVNDIVTNKDECYPNLKLVVADTIDQAYELAEAFSILEWNAENKGVQGFKPAKTINGTWGAAGKNFSHVCNHVLNLVWKLKSVGVGFWYSGHVKTKNVDDAVSGNQYTKLTNNMMQTYFNSIKTKTHILGIAYIDRDIIEEKTGKKDMYSKKELTRKVVSSETRRIKFRDDDYTLDSKSRFADIIDEIPLDADEFIKAIKDAIKNAQGLKSESSNVKEETPTTSAPEPTEPVSEPESTVEEEPETSEGLFDEPEITDDVDDTLSKEDKLEAVKSACKGNADLRAKALKIIKDNGLKTINADIPDAVLDEIYSLI